MTWLQIVSDAVKIGLGGLIGTLSAFVVAQYNHKSTTARMIFERRSRMLIDVSKNVEDFYKQALIFHASLMRLLSSNGADAEVRRKEAHQNRQMLNEKMGECMGAEAQMLLLGEVSCRDKIAKSMQIVSRLDKQIESLLTNKEHAQVRAASNELERNRTEFYAEMRKAFNKI